MIQYRKILELYEEQMSQRTIAASTAHSWNAVSEVIRRAKDKGLDGLTDIMDNKWLEEYLFPELAPVFKGYEVLYFDYIQFKPPFSFQFLLLKVSTDSTSIQTNPSY